MKLYAEEAPKYTGSIAGPTRGRAHIGHMTIPALCPSKQFQQDLIVSPLLKLGLLPFLIFRGCGIL
jgi:hypothetical protein